MAHDRSSPDGLHIQAITDPSKSVYCCLRGTPTVFGTTAQKWLAARIFAVVSALRLRSLPSSRHLAPPSGLSHHHSIVVTAPPCSLFDMRAASAPFFAPPPRLPAFPPPPPSPFLCTRAPHPPFSLLFSLPPSAHHASRAAPTSLDVFHVLPRPPPQIQPGCSLTSFSFLEASTGLRCRPPPACGGAPSAVRVCLADQCFCTENHTTKMKLSNGDQKWGRYNWTKEKDTTTTGEEKRDKTPWWSKELRDRTTGGHYSDEARNFMTASKRGAPSMYNT